MWSQRWGTQICAPTLPLPQAIALHSCRTALHGYGLFESTLLLAVLWLKGPNMARGGVNSLFKNSTNSLKQEVSK